MEFRICKFCHETIYLIRYGNGEERWIHFKSRWFQCKKLYATPMPYNSMEEKMSTNDVPGAKPANRDVLAVGCWAEHSDGSLILVEGVEGDSIVYSIFDMSPDPPVEYRDAMPEKGFKKEFSWKNKNDIKWTWHDKTEFPWQRIMKNFASGQKHVSAESQLSAAAKVAASLNLRGQKIDPENLPVEIQKLATAIMAGVLNAIKE